MTNSIDHSQLLGQLRQLAEKSSPSPAALSSQASPAAKIRTEPGSSAAKASNANTIAGEQFAKVLEATLQDVNLQQMEAQQLAEAFERGERDVDVSQVMIEMQKARISFEALTQVRNKMIAAYQDIMNMPL